MKCKIVRDDMVVSHPGGVNALPVRYQEQIDVRIVTANGREQPRAFWKVGAILDTPDCWRLVQMGCALPADEECAAAANRTALQLAAAQAAYTRLAKGIHPDDFEKYNAGMIDGYNPDGSYKPGPNFHLLKELEEDEGDE